MATLETVPGLDRYPEGAGGRTAGLGAADGGSPDTDARWIYREDHVLPRKFGTHPRPALNSETQQNMVVNLRRFIAGNRRRNQSPVMRRLDGEIQRHSCQGNKELGRASCSPPKDGKI